MATAIITPSPVTIPVGGTVDVEVRWTLNPGTSGTPDQIGHLNLTMDGVILFDDTITRTGNPGTPGETEPTIVLTGTPATGQAKLTCDVATVTAAGAGSVPNSKKFRLS